MKYSIVRNSNILLRIDNELEELKLKTTFMNSRYSEFEVNDVEELFDNALRLIKIRNLKDKSLLSVLQVIDINGEVVFLYFGKKSDCEAMKKLIGFGTIDFLGDIVSTGVDKNVVLVTTIKSKFSANNFISDCILNRDVEECNQVSVLPIKYINTFVSSTDSKVIINTDTTYLDDENFTSLFSCMKDLGTYFETVVAQKEGLQNTVKKM